MVSHGNATFGVFSTWRMQLGGFAVSVSNSFETQSDFEEGSTYP